MILLCRTCIFTISCCLYIEGFMLHIACFQIMLHLFVLFNNLAYTFCMEIIFVY